MQPESIIHIDAEAGFLTTTVGELPQFLETHPGIGQDATCEVLESGEKMPLEVLLARICNEDEALRNLPPNDPLNLVLEYQQNQSRQLAAIGYRVGCLYAYMVLTLAPALIWVLVQLINR